MTAGANPITMPELRELCRYPSTYDESAVYLGEFDFLVRRNLTNLQFLCIWNEQIEEKARGPHVDNINRLFVSFSPAAGANRAATLAEISRICLQADDSYDIKEVAPIELPIVVKVKAQVARIHDIAAVTDQIRQALLSEYGKDSIMARRGMVVLQFKRAYEFLRKNITALQDEGSDFSVVIDPPAKTLLPEHWRFVSPASLTVDVTASDYNIGDMGALMALPDLTPDLESIKAFHEADDLELQLKELTLDIFREFFRHYERDLNTFGAPHLGSFEQIERWIKADGPVHGARQQPRRNALPFQGLEGAKP